MSQDETQEHSEQVVSGVDTEIEEEDSTLEGLPGWAAKISLWLSLFVKVLLIAGAGFSVWQYLEAKQDQRIARTFDLVTLWETDRLQSAYRQVFTAIETYRDENQDVLKSLAGSNPELELEALIGEAIWDLSAQQESGTHVRQSILTLQYFLNRAVTCSKEELCDNRLTSVFFDDLAIDFWDYFGRQIKESARIPSALEIHIEALSAPLID